MPAAERLRVLMVEDHALLAQSLSAALVADGFDVVLPPALDWEALLAAAEAHRPDIVLLDLHLEGGITTLPFIPPLRALGASVVVVTGETDRVRLAECVEAGAIGIIGKHEPFMHLVAAVHEVAELGSLLSPAQRDDLLTELRQQRADDIVRLAPFEHLSPREREILAALVDGRSAESIATDSYVSIATVRSQIRSVLMKLGVNSQLAAVALALKSGWRQ